MMAVLKLFAIVLLASSITALPKIKDSPSTKNFISIGSVTTQRTKTFYTNLEAPGQSCGDVELQWVDVLVYCEAHGMKGARVNSAAENRLVTDALKPVEDCSHVFIAATDLENPGNWAWFDRKPLVFSNFTDEEQYPGNSCASIHVHEDGEWHSELCSYTVRPLCESFESSVVPEKKTKEVQENFISIGSVVEVATKTFYSNIEEEGTLCSQTEMSWFDAVTYCENQGMTIAKIDSLEETEQVIQILQDRDCSHFWLGATTFGSNGKWLWLNADANGNRELTYSDWAEGEPGDGKEFNCMTQYYRNFDIGTWKTRPCGEFMRPLCQKVEKQVILA